MPAKLKGLLLLLFVLTIASTPVLAQQPKSKASHLGSSKGSHKPSRDPADAAATLETIPLLESRSPLSGFPGAMYLPASSGQLCKIFTRSEISRL